MATSNIATSEYHPAWRGVARAAGITALFWLGACMPAEPPGSGEETAAAAPAVPVESAGPVGPVALAPSMTGMSAAPTEPPVRSTAAAPPPPAPEPAPVAVAPPPPPPPPAPPAPEPTVVVAAAPADAATAPPAPSIVCPPDSVAMWSKPDLAGVPAAICHQLGPPR